MTKRIDYFNLIIGLFNVISGMLCFFLMLSFYKLLDVRVVLLGIWVTHLNIKVGAELLGIARG